MSLPSARPPSSGWCLGGGQCSCGSVSQPASLSQCTEQVSSWGAWPPEISPCCSASGGTGELQETPLPQQERISKYHVSSVGAQTYPSTPSLLNIWLHGFRDPPPPIAPRIVWKNSSLEVTEKGFHFAAGNCVEPELRRLYLGPGERSISSNTV